jgi:hypothetical protein
MLLRVVAAFSFGWERLGLVACTCGVLLTANLRELLRELGLVLRFGFLGTLPLKPCGLIFEM